MCTSTYIDFSLYTFMNQYTSISINQNPFIFIFVHLSIHVYPDQSICI